MGVKLKNIITDYNGKDDLLIIEEMKKYFQFTQVKLFDSQFKGIVGQINEGNLENESDEEGFLEKHNLKEYGSLLDIIYEFEEKIIDFSKIFPDKIFAYIDVDCFGGTCMYTGFVVKNGEKIYNQDYNKGSHIDLLKFINKDFSSWHFEPFDRDFFIKKGEIKGLIKNFTIAGLWLALKTDYPDTKKYYIDGSSNELILRRHKFYYYYFKSLGENIEITGVIYDDSDEIIEEIKSIPDRSFIGMDFDLDISVFKDN